MSWFYVKCAECARRYGPDLAPRLFRADISNWGDAAVEIRTDSGWKSILIEDNERMMWPVCNCVHNHRFEDSFTLGALVDQVGRAIEAAVRFEAECGLLEPTNDRRAPGQERTTTRRIQEQVSTSGG